MEIWLDTSNVNLVASTHKLGILDGVTTNPTILAASNAYPNELIEKLLEAQQDPVAVQVLATDTREMYRQSKILWEISSRILVKIPVTQAGISTIYALSQENIPSLATAIFEVPQALLAFKAGARYLAPYLGRIADTGQNPIEVLSKMQKLKTHFGFEGKIMGAGIRDLPTAMACMDLGVSAMTLSDSVFAAFIQNSESTLQSLDKFSKDWAKYPFGDTLWNLQENMSK